MTMSHDGLTKLIEECGELIQICAKKQAYFNTDVHPDGAGSMKRRIEEEIADVTAACRFVCETFNLDLDFIEKRHEEKLERFDGWHARPSHPTDEEIVAWADAQVRQQSFNRSIAVEIAVAAAKWVRNTTQLT